MLTPDFMMCDGQYAYYAGLGSTKNSPWSVQEAGATKLSRCKISSLFKWTCFVWSFEVSGQKWKHRLHTTDSAHAYFCLDLKRLEITKTHFGEGSRKYCCAKSISLYLRLLILIKIGVWFMNMNYVWGTGKGNRKGTFQKRHSSIASNKALYINQMKIEMVFSCIFIYICSCFWFFPQFAN